MSCAFRNESKKLVLTLLAAALLLCVALIAVRNAWSATLERGYVAFNAADYPEARKALELIAKLGDSRAQQLLSHMCGLGLGQPVDFGCAIEWMRRSAPNSFAERAFDLGVGAVDGLYGTDKKALGVVWLRIAHYSGAKRAGEKLKGLEPI